MKPLTLRTKLTLFYSITVSVLLTGFALIYYNVLSAGLDRDLTQEVLDRTSGLRGYLHFVEGMPVLMYDQNDPDQVSFINKAARYYEVYELSTGMPVGVSEELFAMGVVYRPEDVRRYAQGPPSSIDLQTDQGQLRLRNEVVQAEGNAYMLSVGASMQQMEDTGDSFLKALAWLIPSGVLLGGIASWFMAGKALQPVAALGLAARGIAVSNLDRRLPVRGTNDELDNLAIEFNDTLARLEKAVGEMKQFTASISHELRTPLAVLRGEAEVALMQANSPDQYRRVLASQLEEFEKLSRMINQLLTLARAESGEVEIEREFVDISSMAQSLAEQLEPVAASKDVNLSWDCEPRVTVNGDSSWIERIVLNLVDNAIKFTSPEDTCIGHRDPQDTPCCDSQVSMMESESPGRPARYLNVSIAPIHHAPIGRMERPGLRILVQWAVDQHHGSVNVESTPGEGSRFFVRFPA
jgi:signal transduction histidine kinase